MNLDNFLMTKHSARFSSLLEGPKVSPGLEARRGERRNNRVRLGGTSSIAESITSFWFNKTNKKIYFLGRASGFSGTWKGTSNGPEAEIK